MFLLCPSHQVAHFLVQTRHNDVPYSQNTTQKHIPVNGFPKALDAKNDRVSKFPNKQRYFGMRMIAKRDPQKIMQ